MSKTKQCIFTASIILNILLLGVTGGLVYKKNHDVPWKSFQEKLSPEAQAIVEENYNQGRADIRPLLSGLMKEREEMIAVMNEQPFDEKRFDESTKRVQKIQKDISDSKAESIKNLMEKLPYEDRVKVTDNLARFLTWDRSGGKRHGKAGPVERVP